MSAPTVTVLMPVYNGAAHLKEALESILAQSHQDFELLLIDDGSTDESLEIIESTRDSRIHLKRNEVNKGLIHTLNDGLSVASGRYVMRMDADDVAMPQRLERQLDFMVRHPGVGICGTWSRTFGAVKASWETRFPPAHAQMVARMVFNTAISHPTAMLDMARMNEHGLRYDESAPHAEDYDLWVRASEKFELANVPEVLLDYRVHAKQVSQQHEQVQRQTADRVRIQLLRRLGVKPDPAQSALHSRIGAYDWPRDPHFRNDAVTWLRHVAKHARAEGVDVNAAVSRLCREKATEVHDHVFQRKKRWRRIMMQWYGFQGDGK